MTGVVASLTADGGENAPPAAQGNAVLSSMWAPIAERLAQLLVGDFEILGELGEGGMAAVFLAHEHALNRKVALKVMSPAIMMGEGMIGRFQQEAVTQANLQHANIVGVHGVRNVDDLHFFVMQFVPGRTLQHVLKAEHAVGRHLAIPVVQSLLFQVGSALAYAHRRGVIHRDVKPGNILLNGDGDAVVTDFGIAKVAEAPSQTMTGTVVGTPTYMSPEQCFASELTPASDQYSLGVVAYELITGRTPFEGTSFVLMQAHTMKAPPPISVLRPDCPPELEAAVMRMLAKEREERFADLDDAMHALGARAPGTRSDDPLRRELQRLSDVKGVQAKLADVLRGPLSPAPRTKGATRTGAATSQSGARLTQPAPPQTSPPSATQILAGGAALPSVADLPRAASAPIEQSVEVAPTKSRLVLTIGGGVVALVAAIGLWLFTRPAAGDQSVGTAPTTAAVAPVTEAPVGDSTPTPSPASSTVMPSTGAPAVATVGGAATAPGAAPRLMIVAPPSPTVTAGGRLQLEARSDRSRGAPPLRWRSGAPGVASVGARTGLLEALDAGRVVVYLEQGDRRDSLQLTVTAKVSTVIESVPSRPVVAQPGPTLVPAPVQVPPRTVEPSPTNPVASEKTDEELIADAERALALYAEALGSRDTTRIRRAFSAAPTQLLGQWQSMYDATKQVRVKIANVTPEGSVSVPLGSMARFRVKQTVTFSVAGSRQSQVQAAEYTATLRRDTSGWTLAGISDR